MTDPTAYTLDYLRSERLATTTCSTLSGWVIARPIVLRDPVARSIAHRFRCAWLVFFGRADVVVWRFVSVTFSFTTF
jgi:hypothetical protein